MSKQDIGSLAVKILGIYMIIQGINVFSNLITIYILTPQQESINYLIGIFPFLFLIIFGALLWLLSETITVVMIKGQSHIQEDPGLKASDIQRISFSVLGLSLLGNSIPRLVSLVESVYPIRGNIPVKVFRSLGVGGLVTQFILGIGFFLGSHILVKFLDGIRNARIE